MHPNPPAFTNRAPQRLTVEAPKPASSPVIGERGFEEIDPASEAVAEVGFAGSEGDVGVERPWEVRRKDWPWF
ncbi:unnamed protein product [Camellia sinensis]